MSNILPEKKVTVIVESLDGRVKEITIPLAANPNYGVSDTYDLETGKLADEKSFGFSCYALYDIDQNLFADEKVFSQTEWEDRIIDQARDILRSRWQNPETQTVDTTSINVVRGDN